MVQTKSPDILPAIMVAPNGARKTRADHPTIPVTPAAVAETARLCEAEGAGAIHFHVRDADEAHILDAGLYQETIAELEHAVPGMHLQITTETVGRYGPDDMRKLVRDVRPQGASIGVSEMIPSGTPTAEDVQFYNWTIEAGIRLQHICYAPQDVALLGRLLDASNLSRDDIWCLFVLGHYTGRISHPDLLPPFLGEMANAGINGDWAICAFATAEAACLKAAIAAGGKVRVGFENSMYMADGSIAADNAARVREAKQMMAAS